MVIKVLSSVVEVSRRIEISTIGKLFWVKVLYNKTPRLSYANICNAHSVEQAMRRWDEIILTT